MIQGILKAYLQALRSLLSPGVIWHLLWPGIVVFLVWATALLYGWFAAAEGLLQWLAGIPWSGNWGAEAWQRWAFSAALKLFLLLLSVPLAFLLTVLLVALFSLPLILDRVSCLEYPDLERRGGGSMLGSALNAMKSLLFLLLGGMLCLPLLFIPGLGLLVVLLLTAWFNLRCFRYDALMNHADRLEMRQVPKQHSQALFGIGILGGLLGCVPVLNLFVPVITGLAFTHYLLTALRCQRLNN